MNKKTVAKVIASVALKMAEKACGSASKFGTYQLNESKEVQNFFAKK